MEKKQGKKIELSSVFIFSSELEPDCGLATYAFFFFLRMGDDRNHSAVKGNHLIKVCGSETNQT